MEKKAIMSFNFLAMVPRIIFLVIVLIVCVILIRLFLNNRFDVTDVQGEILISALLYGTGGISYTDPLTGRIYPEIVDKSQLDNAELDQGLYFPDNHMLAAQIMMYSALNDPTTASLNYYNKQWYDNWEPLAKLSIPGIGGVAKYEKTLPIIRRDENGELKLGKVSFTVLQPKSLRAVK